MRMQVDRSPIDIRSIGSGAYHAISVENLRQAGWLDDAALSRSTSNGVDQSRGFPTSDVRTERGSSAIGHTHAFPTVTVLISGEITLMHGGARPDRR